MDELPSINVEGLLIRLVCDAVSHAAAEHHLAAAHEIVHYILKRRLERVRIDQIEVNLL